jgi:hypothetical protein
MMEVALFVVVIGQFCLIWHRLGRLEGRIEKLNNK